MRKLAAVLCIDVAGYSKLMGRDEAGTLLRVKAAFTAFDPALPAPAAAFFRDYAFGKGTFSGSDFSRKG